MQDNSSAIVLLVCDGKMPHGAPPLSVDDIQLIVDWINEGAKNN